MALNAYLTLVGETQGKIKGSSKKVGREGSIVVIAVQHEIVSPRDAASGLPTGKRQHKPIVITKEIDKATPLLYRAFVENENLPRLKLEYWQPSKTGKEVQFYTVELHNAGIAGIRFELPNTKDPENILLKEMEYISFTYQHISWTWMEGGISSEDDWEAPVV